MFTAPSSNDHLSTGTPNLPSNELHSFFLQTVQAYRSGPEKEKVSILHEVRNRIEKDENGEKMKEVGEMGLRMGFVSELCVTLGSECSPFLFNVASSVLTLVVGCVLHPKRKKMSDLLPSLLSLTHHADPTLSVPATHAVGLVCDSSLSCGDVEGVLSGGVVEKVCSWVEGWKEDGKEVGKVLGLLRVVDKLCVGLKGALRSAQKQEQEQKEKEKQKVKSGTDQAQVGQKEEEDRDGWSLVSRCQSALDLMENTLLGLCSARESEEKESSAEVEVMTQVGGMLIRHFRHVVSGGRKEVGVIAVDVGREMRVMEERERQREEEMKKRLDEMERKEEEREREAEDREREARQKEEDRENAAKKREEERERRFELKMAELNEQAERHKRFIEEGEEREREASRRREEERRKEEERRRGEERRKEEMKRQSKVGAAAIEWFPADGYSLNGSVFTRSGRGSGSPTLLSAEFGNVVVRFTFTFQTITSCTRIGIVASAQTATVKGGSDFVLIVGGAGWDMHSKCRYDRQDWKSVQSGTACAAGRGGQRVMLEADGRDGKRTLRLSQDGQTQPTFFSNIPVTFRFAIWIGAGDAVSIESVEVVAEPQLSGGGTAIPMNEA
ncbi:hypothetical protein BLNAU_6093 [Blattamonas nauphoetae]|uniref:Uncharacterized protein n=1 Tax=Blattamonas nauphoetae TaxID=2049346 RepID=A0ABQ9Y544_9EUKA|nr:hypothetical protein BLNAU_6093 [Blattamonas nauphoetae]